MMCRSQRFRFQSVFHDSASRVRELPSSGLFLRLSPSNTAEELVLAVAYCDWGWNRRSFGTLGAGILDTGVRTGTILKADAEDYRPLPFSTAVM